MREPQTTIHTIGLDFFRKLHSHLIGFNSRSGVNFEMWLIWAGLWLTVPHKVYIRFVNGCLMKLFYRERDGRYLALAASLLFFCDAVRGVVFFILFESPPKLSDGGFFSFVLVVAVLAGVRYVNVLVFLIIFQEFLAVTWIFHYFVSENGEFYGEWREPLSVMGYLLAVVLPKAAVAGALFLTVATKKGRAYFVTRLWPSDLAESKGIFGAIFRERG